jgi:hypothetical protein
MVALRASLVNAVLPLSNDNCQASNLVRRTTGMGRVLTTSPSNLLPRTSHPN